MIPRTLISQHPIRQIRIGRGKSLISQEKTLQRQLILIPQKETSPDLSRAGAYLRAKRRRPRIR